MRACTTAGGGVMFVFDEMERKSAEAPKKKYADILTKEERAPRLKTFGKRKAEKDTERRAA